MNNLHEFKELGVSQNILEALRRKGFEQPTPIQKQAIPHMLAEKGDFVGMAQTGTGKTAAFGIPIIEKIDERSPTPQVLILAPTRELAIQVSEELNSLKGQKRLNIIPIYGGQSMGLQLKHLKRGVDIVVGTPGRVMDHMRRGTLVLDRVKYVVLDEADEMLNMGFIDDVREILTKTNPDRQTYLFSATMPREIEDISRRFMKNRTILRTENRNVTTDLTDQIYFEVAESDKLEALCRIIDIEEDFYGLIFCRTKNDVDKVTAQLIDRGYDAEGMHGDVSQMQREKILNRFKKQQINIVVATDVAARGIDVQNLTHVINYSLPQDPQAYVHRIGRTGRAGNEGTAITFITPQEHRRLMMIKRMAKTDIRKEKLPKISDIIDAKKARILAEVERLADTETPEGIYMLARDILANNDPVDAVAALLQHAFEDELNPANYNEIRNVYPKIKGKTRLMISIGKRNNMSKRKLVEFIKKRARIDDRRIDDVQVFNDYSYITVPFRDAERVLQTFKRENRGKRRFVEVANGRA